MDDKNIKKQKEEQIEEIIDEAQVEEEVLDDKDDKIASLEDQLRRAVADYRNLERRSIDERMEAIKYANKNLIEALLPAFDTLFLAGKYTKDESVKLTSQRLIEILKENGIEQVKTLDTKYNPDIMECIEVVEGEDGKVIEEMRPGFTLHTKLIRPAQVKVGGKK